MPGVEWNYAEYASKGRGFDWEKNKDKYKKQAYDNFQDACDFMSGKFSAKLSKKVPTVRIKFAESLAKQKGPISIAHQIMYATLNSFAHAARTGPADQAKKGDAKDKDRPSVFFFRDRAKFDAWVKLRGMGKDVAEKAYRDEINALVREFGFEGVS